MTITMRITKNQFPHAPAMAKTAIRAAWGIVGPSIVADAQAHSPVDTGALRASHEQQIVGDNLVISAGAGLPDARALYVHQGTHKMGARPWLKQAVDDAGPSIQDAFTIAFTREFS